jgi:glycosyltransferase involved in cell wall biosynthesis
MNNTPALSIVLPCYNEAGNIPNIYSRFREILTGRQDVEVILVDNGSTDNSADFFAQESSRPENSFARVVIVKKNQGYGFGIMSGVREARGEIIAWTHADLQTDPKDVLDAFKIYTSEKDYQNSLMKGRRIARNTFDTFFTAGMGIICTMALGKKLHDVNAQPKMFHRSFLEYMQSPPNDFSLDLYILYLARRRGMPIIEHKVNFSDRLHGEAKGGGSLKGKVKLIRRTWSYIFQLKKEISGGLR